MRKTIVLAVCILPWIGLNAAQGTDWTKWRGPNGNGIVNDAKWDPQAISGSPKIVWDANLGLGYSAVAVKGDRLYAMGNVEKNSNGITTGTDIIYCFHARTGEELWRYTYPCRTDDVWPGPSASPVVDEDRLYTICDDTGDLFCLNALTGKVIWKRNVVKEFGTVPPYDGVGYAGSACVEGDLVLYNLNTAGIALNKYTGKTVWASQSGRCSFSTPVVFDHQSKRKVALFGAKSLFILDVSTGKVLSSYPWKTNCNENTADPIIDGNRIFISSAYGMGCALFNMNGHHLDLVWKHNDLNNQFTSNIYINGYVYGINEERSHRNAFKCIELNTGKVMWSQNMEFGSLIAADNKLLFLDEKGMLFIVEATHKGYNEIASGKVFINAPSRGKGRNRNRSYWWTNPVLVNGYLYVRSDKGYLVCLDMTS